MSSSAKEDIDKVLDKYEVHGFSGLYILAGERPLEDGSYRIVTSDTYEESDIEILIQGLDKCKEILLKRKEELNESAD